MPGPLYEETEVLLALSKEAFKINFTPALSAAALIFFAASR